MFFIEIIDPSADHDENPIAIVGPYESEGLAQSFINQNSDGLDEFGYYAEVTVGYSNISDFLEDERKLREETE